MNDDKKTQTGNLLVPTGTSSDSTEIKKSKFLAFCYPVSDEKKAREIVHSLKAEHKTARHVVYAFVCGTHASSTMGMSDDGEPRGTAGKPVLQVLKGSGITNILCAVVRYFGGIKLGTGGLVKAYTEAARNAVEKLETRELVAEFLLTVTVGYESHDIVAHFLKSRKGCRIVEEDFKNSVTMKIAGPEEDEKTVMEEISAATSGRAVFG